MDEEVLESCDPFGNNPCTKYKFKWETGEYLDEKISLLEFGVAKKINDATFGCTYHGATTRNGVKTWLLK